MPDPKSEHEWAVHSLNIHGSFFERWCKNIIKKSKSWRFVAENYPVEFPPTNGFLKGQESSLDIRTEFKPGKNPLTLLIECKKNNPDFTNWIFFRRTDSNRIGVYYRISNIQKKEPETGWTVQGELEWREIQAPLVSDAREIKGAYLDYKKGDKTRTTNSSIQQAAEQIALATKAITDEEEKFSKLLSEKHSESGMPWRTQKIIPMIVTTAAIQICEFNPEDISRETGEIPYEKAKISDHPFVVYEYALPKHLQYSPGDPTNIEHRGDPVFRGCKYLLCKVIFLKNSWRTFQFRLKSYRSVEI
jgi:hypothetical protein